MSTRTRRRAYEELRDIIERRAGIMAYERRGYRYGAWEIHLDGKSAIIESVGRRTFAGLDQLCVPAVAHPKTRDNYLHKLVPDAEKRLSDLLV